MRVCNYFSYWISLKILSFDGKSMDCKNTFDCIKMNERKVYTWWEVPNLGLRVKYIFLPFDNYYGNLFGGNSSKIIINNKMLYNEIRQNECQSHCMYSSEVPSIIVFQKSTQLWKQNGNLKISLFKEKQQLCGCLCACDCTLTNHIVSFSRNYCYCMAWHRNIGAQFTFHWW